VNAAMLGLLAVSIFASGAVVGWSIRDSREDDDRPMRDEGDWLA
jgi:hypothetical protein